MIYCADLCFLANRICKITYIEHSMESFEYVFEPNYDVINSLQEFHGIPGIDLSLHKDRYVRKRILPVLIGERIPLPGNNHFHQTIRINGMCPLEYLSLCEKEYFGDLFVFRVCSP